MNPGEFPHSEISGSMLICSSPKLFAAYHVFHRLPVPRHSPCALVRLTFQTFFKNICYPLDSLLPTKIIVTLPFEIVIFLKKRTYYNLCFAVIIQFSRYVLSPRLSWCDGRCVQGPGTYSPQHADPRLLAIPTSCRRVAACSPNWDVVSEFCSTSRSCFSLFNAIVVRV